MYFVVKCRDSQLYLSRIVAICRDSPEYPYFRWAIRQVLIWAINAGRSCMSLRSFTLHQVAYCGRYPPGLSWGTLLVIFLLMKLEK